MSEREAVVAWLREQLESVTAAEKDEAAAEAWLDAAVCQVVRTTLETAIEGIERGDHMKGPSDAP